MELIALHHNRKYTDEVAEILNSEWPRSKAARLYSLEKSRDELPCSLVLLSDGKVVGHSKLLPVQGMKNSCLLESVIVPKSLRGKGYGRILMAKTEEFAKGMGFIQMFLNTIDKQEFYEHLGFQFSHPVVSLGANSHLVPDSMISKMLGGLEIEKKPSKEEAAPISSEKTPESSSTPAPPPPPPPPPPPLLPKGGGDTADNRHVVRLSRNSVSWMKKELQ